MNLQQVDLNPAAKGNVVEMTLPELNTAVMLLPKVERTYPAKCPIIHHTGYCHCHPPVVVDASKLAACEDAARYVLGALKRRGTEGKLSDADLIFLAASAAKMAGHWGRLALGQQDPR